MKKYFCIIHIAAILLTGCVLKELELVSFILISTIVSELISNYFRYPKKLLWM